MTTFKATVKKPRSDGFYTVYIRVTHQRKTSYIKTNKIIDPAHITSNGKLTDPVVNEYCAIIIRQYHDSRDSLPSNHLSQVCCYQEHKGRLYGLLRLLQEWSYAS